MLVSDVLNNFAFEMTTKRKILLSLLTLLLVAAGVYGYSVWQLSRLNTSYRFMESQGNLIASFQAGENNSVIQPSGNTIFLDLGSRHSFISEDAAMRLREQGYSVEFRNTLLITTDWIGRYRLYTKIAHLDITLLNPTMPDSTFVIHDADLILLPKGGPTILGMDLLSNFVIERSLPENIINFYKQVPPGYITVSRLKIYNMGNTGTTGRAAISLVVNDEEPRDYYLTTGTAMSKHELVQPYDNLHTATSRVSKDPNTGLYTQHHCRVNFGNRLRYSSVVYSDTIHTDDYSINPLNFFDQDFVLDMPGRRLMVHKTRE